MRPIWKETSWKFWPSADNWRPFGTMASGNAWTPCATSASSKGSGPREPRPGRHGPEGGWCGAETTKVSAFREPTAHLVVRRFRVAGALLQAGCLGNGGPRLQDES